MKNWTKSDAIIKRNLILLLGFCLGMVTFFGCTKLSDQAATNAYLVPPNAQNVTYINDKWGTFELENQKYIFGNVGSAELVYFPVIESSKSEEQEKQEKKPLVYKCPSCGATIVITDLGPVHKVAE